MGFDFYFMASLCRSFRTNYLSKPTFIKHEFAADGALPAGGHVVTGRRALTFIRDWLRAGERQLTIEYLREARRCLPRFGRAIALDLLLRGTPGVGLARRIYSVCARLGDYYQRHLAVPARGAVR